MCGSCYRSGCATAGRGRCWPPVAVSLCCPGYPPASCCPHPLRTCCPHLCGPLYPSHHCRAYGGHGHQLHGAPIGHCGAGLGDGNYLSCGHWSRLTLGCCGCLPARPPWSCLPGPLSTPAAAPPARLPMEEVSIPQEATKATPPTFLPPPAGTPQPLPTPAAAPSTRLPTEEVPHLQ